MTTMLHHTNEQVDVTSATLFFNTTHFINQTHGWEGEWADSSANPHRSMKPERIVAILLGCVGFLANFLSISAIASVRGRLSSNLRYS